VFSCHLLISVLSLGELKSRGEKARRNFRQLERVVRQQLLKFNDSTFAERGFCVALEGKH
jgi:hypothetical protein